MTCVQLPGDARQEALERLWEQEGRRDFDLTAAPLMRLKIVQLEDTDWRVLWSHHHLLLDGWSVSLLVQELFRHYAALQTGSVLALPAAPAYRDYMAWLHRQDLLEAQAYWRECMSGVEAAGRLVGERRTGESQGQAYRGRMAVAMERVEEFARHHRVTANAVVQAAWALTLSRFAGSQDVVFGVTVSGRPAELADVERRVGLFINTLPMRVQSHDDPEIAQFVYQVHELQSQMIERQYTRLSQVQRWSGLPAGAKLLDSSFVFENYPIEAPPPRRASRGFCGWTACAAWSVRITR